MPAKPQEGRAAPSRGALRGPGEGHVMLFCLQGRVTSQASGPQGWWWVQSGCNGLILI